MITYLPQILFILLSIYNIGEYIYRRKLTVSSPISRLTGLLAFLSMFFKISLLITGGIFAHFGFWTIIYLIYFVPSFLLMLVGVVILVFFPNLVPEGNNLDITRDYLKRSNLKLVSLSLLEIALLFFTGYFNPLILALQL